MSKGTPTKKVLIRGYSGSDFLDIRVDETGRLYAIMTGTDGTDITGIKTDSEGNLIIKVLGTDGSSDVQIKTSSAGEIITDPIKDVDLTIARDANGLVSSIVSVYNGRTNTQTFGRDANNQLTSITSVIT